jgi:hypothetical protein
MELARRASGISASISRIEAAVGRFVPFAKYTTVGFATATTPSDGTTSPVTTRVVTVRTMRPFRRVTICARQRPALIKTMLLSEPRQMVGVSELMK